MTNLTHGALLATVLAALGGCQHQAQRANNATLEERLARLEAAYAKDAEALEFLNKVYEQQKAQQKAQQERAQREDPDPDAVFAVDISSNVKLGEVEGPNTALITIVEAWDFA